MRPVLSRVKAVPIRGADFPTEAGGNKEDSETGDGLHGPWAQRCSGC